MIHPIRQKQLEQHRATLRRTQEPAKLSGSSELRLETVYKGWGMCHLPDLLARRGYVIRRVSCPQLSAVIKDQVATTQTEPEPQTPYQPLPLI